MNRLNLLFILALLPILSGCLITKVVTVPMRVGGEIVGVVPVVGDVMEGVIDTSADVIDVIPL